MPHDLPRFGRRRFLKAAVAAPALTWTASKLSAGKAAVFEASPANPGIFDIRAFGAKGDGRADDTPAFRALHAHLLALQRAAPERRFEILLPRGHYRYGWNRWLWGLRRVTVRGEGAAIQCISSSSWDSEKFVLATNQDFFSISGPDQTPNLARIDYGRLIRTAEPGSDSVTLRHAADSAAFMAGRYVCVMSFDQQFGGYPPNCRYFDYAKVVSVSGVRVTLDRPLRHRHSEDSFEDEAVPESRGRARIVPIDRPDRPYALEQEIVGITALANPNAKERFFNVLLVAGVHDFRMRDCNLINLTPTMGHRCLIEDTAIEFTEPDKLLTEVTFARCRIGRISQATGIKRLTLTQCRIDRTSNIQSRTVHADGCAFLGASQAEDGASGLSLEGFTLTRSMRILRSTFRGKGGRQDSAVSDNQITQIGLAPPISIRPDAIVIPRDDPRVKQLLCGVEIGDTLLVGGEFAGTTYCDGRFGVIRNIHADAKRVTVALSLSAPVGPNDIVFTPRVRQLICQGNQYDSVNAVPPLSLSTDWERAVERSSTYRWRYASAAFDQTIFTAPGLVQQVSVDVLRPYRGPDGGAFLILTARTPGYRSVVLAFDLTAAGHRAASTAGTPGREGSDALARIAPETFVWDFYAHHATSDRGGYTLLTGAPDQQADYILTIRTLPPFPQPAAG